MKKVLLAAAVCLSLTNNVHGQQGHELVDGVVSKFQQYFNAGQTDSLYSMMSPRIQQLMPLDKTKAMM